ncbi:MAG: LuxR C-terminal-related transcriptional regulator, partial [Gemmatimonadota bacterium]
AALRKLGRCSGGTEEIATAAAMRWDLVLLDLALPGMGGIEATTALKQASPDTIVVALTVFEDAGTILEAICAGVDGYLAKRLPPDRIVEELRVVMEGGSPLSPGVARTVLQFVRRLGGRDPSRATGPKPTDLGLTPREEDVLGCLVEGLKYKDVAAELGISTNTVRSHVRHIYAKLQVGNAAEAVSRAIREGLV